MTDIAIEIEEILVTTGPSEVQVQVDIGEKGDIGTQIYTSLGDPNDSLNSVTPALLDLAINVLAEDPGYSYIYQWSTNQAGTPQWMPIIKLNPSIKSKRFSKIFEDGSVVINLYIDEVTDSDSIATLTRDNFAIQFSIENSNPIASSISLGEIFQESVEERLVLPLTITASELSGSTWSSLDGLKNVHILASVV